MSWNLHSYSKHGVIPKNGSLFHFILSLSGLSNAVNNENSKDKRPKENTENESAKGNDEICPVSLEEIRFS